MNLLSCDTTLALHMYMHFKIAHHYVVVEVALAFSNLPFSLFAPSLFVVVSTASIFASVVRPTPKSDVRH